MDEAGRESKQRDRVIAGNDSDRQAAGDIRVSIWAIGIAVLIGFAVFGWMWLR